MRRPGAALAAIHLTLALLLMGAPAALGHATLEDSDPQRGAVVDRPPGAVTLEFNEPVEAGFGAVRVFDAGGEEVDTGQAEHPGGDGSRIAVPVTGGDLGDGSFTVTYRVVSADGHVVSGGYVFSVGRAGAAPAETVAELIGESGAGSTATAGLAIARAAQYAALGIALGMVAFLLLIWPAARRAAAPGSGAEEAPPGSSAEEALAGDGAEDALTGSGTEDALARRARAILITAALTGLISAAAAIVFHAAGAAGVDAGAALDPAILEVELGTRFGTVWTLTAIAWAFAALVLAAARRRLGRGRVAVAALLVSLILIALEPALSGHPSTQTPGLVLFPANLAHVLAMSVWVGGLAAIAFALPAATRTIDGADRTRLLAAVLTRFSPLALASVAALIVTGILQAAFLLEAPADLLATGYGRAILAKAAILVLLLVPLGAHNRYVSLPRLRRIAAGGDVPGGAGRTLRRALRAEVALLAAVLVVTGILAGSSPPVAVTGGPYSGSAELGPAQLEVAVDPASVGSNQVHLYLFDAVDGSQYDRIEDLRADVALPEEELGPIALDLNRAGPGHYVAQGAILTARGEWDLAVAMRVSDFDEYSAELEVPVR